MLWLLGAAFLCGCGRFEPAADLTSTSRDERSNAGVDGGSYVGPFRAEKSYFEAWEGTRYRPFFVRAVNLGAALPGDGPNDLRASEAMYTRWLELLGGAGVNAVRLYTLHFPAFYKALSRYNEAHAQAPIYFIQGIWLREPPEGSVPDLYLQTELFHAAMEEVVDCIHGARVVPLRSRAAYGAYEVDVSRWTLAWLPGREVLGTEVKATDRLHPAETSFEGAHLRLADGSPSATWVARQLDHLVAYESSRHGGLSRPVGFSNWLETDPLRHRTEPTSSGMDIAQLDLAQIAAVDAPAGYFVSYHAYPYYPNFVSDDPDYRLSADEQGPNSYLGLLKDLRRHHGDTPLLIAEFGVPSSWGRAHSSFSGMHHGGLSEAQQGTYAARMIQNIYDVGAAGGSYFHLTDGWWKKVWITNPITRYFERHPLWHDLTNPQQSYGLIAFQLPAPDFSGAPATVGAGQVREVKAVFDAEFVHLRIQLASPLLDGEPVVIGIDTYSNPLGETRLPNGVTTTRRHEFALSITAPDRAELQVLRAYDLHSIREKQPPEGVLYRSAPSSSGDWGPIRWKMVSERISDDGVYAFPSEDFQLGLLRARRSGTPTSSLDAVVIDGPTLTVRLPWVMLNFIDPSRRRVMSDDLSTAGVREYYNTEGIGFSVWARSSLVEVTRKAWPTWDKAPETEQRLKASAPIFFEKLQSLPTWLD